MSFDYFYGQQSDLFTFYRVPKVLFTNERFWNISADAKMLYGILLDRMSLTSFLPGQTPQRPTVRKQIGKTTYIVRVHFSETAKETMEDKIKRMLREEVRKM